jgi:cytochrome c biogenesis protein CcmG/thiol:disulfide interchange protein DsbE
MRLLLNLQSGLAWCSVAKWRYKPVMPQELLAKIIFHRTKKFKMKYSFPGMLFCLVLLACHGNLTAQKSIPSVEIKTLNGQAVNIKDYTHKGEKITILSFWATWCKPCIQELDAIKDLYADWQELYDVQLVAVTIDDQRTLAKVPPLVQTKGWEYVVLADPNRALMAALNFQTPPQTFLLNRNGDVIYEHTGYVPGNEYELEEKIKAETDKK